MKEKKKNVNVCAQLYAPSTNMFERKRNIEIEMASSSYRIAQSIRTRACVLILICLYRRCTFKCSNALHDQSCCSYHHIYIFVWLTRRLLHIISGLCRVIVSVPAAEFEHTRERTRSLSHLAILAVWRNGDTNLSQDKELRNQFSHR